MSDKVLYLGISIPINYMIGSYPVMALYSGLSQIWSAKKSAPFVKAEGNWTQDINVFTSNKISDSQSTIEKVYFKNLGGKTITISYDVDSEIYYDYLTIFALDSETKVLATSKDNGTENGYYGMVGSVDFTFPDNKEHFICFKYSKDGSGYEGRDNAIVTFPSELFGEAKWVLVGEVIRYEYEDNTLYKCIYQDLQLSVGGVLTNTHMDGELISKEVMAASIISFNDTIKLNGTPYEFVVPEVDPDVVYKLSFNSPTLIIFQNPIKISSWNITTKSKLTEIRGLNFVNTSNMTNMSYMFQNCSKLTSLNLSGWDTSNVTNMNGMFYDCTGLTSLDVSNFNTSKVTDMSAMFRSCKVLTSLNLSNFDTSYVTNMCFMFERCYNLTSLDLSNFDTSNVTDMRAMFSSCSGLTSLDLSNFNTSKVDSIGWIFDSCSSLTSLNLSGWNLSKIISASDMFYDCSKLTTITGPITGISEDIDLRDSPLTHDSAMVFMNGLNTVTRTKSITFKSTTYETLTEAEIASATAKGWTVKSAA